MRNKKWKKFSSLTGKCYSNMIGVEEDAGCWEQAFDLLREIVLEERQKTPGFALELEQLEEATEYEYDIEGWLEDCLDEIDMREEKVLLLKMCDNLLSLFRWPEYTGSDLKFRKTTALCELGRGSEAAKYCREWIKKEPENVTAATAGVYAFIETEEFDAAEELVERFILDRSNCTEENDIMFTAASKLYETTGKSKEKKQMEDALEKYDQYLEKYFTGSDEEAEDEDFFDELPFN